MNDELRGGVIVVIFLCSSQNRLHRREAICVCLTRGSFERKYKRKLADCLPSKQHNLPWKQGSREVRDLEEIRRLRLLRIFRVSWLFLRTVQVRLG